MLDQHEVPGALRSGEAGGMALGVDGLLWGKSRGLPRPYPLVCHLADVAAVVLALWDLVLSPGQRRRITHGLGLADEEQAARLVALWAGLHDIGKAIPGFQTINPDAFAALVDGGRYPVWKELGRLSHDRATHLVLGLLLRDRGYLLDQADRVASPAHRVAQLLGGHHGRFHEPIGHKLWKFGFAVAPELGDGPWQVQRVAMFDLLHRLLGCPEPPSEIDVEAGVLAAGVTVVGDWLASQESFLTERLAELTLPAGGLLDAQAVAKHFARSRELAPDLVRRAGLGRVALRQGSFRETFGVPPRPLQASIAEGLPGLVRGPGVLLVMAPTGEGKTEAALFAARLLGEAAGTPGLFVALPTMATADQMHARVATYADRCLEGSAALTLLHSMAWLSDVTADTSDEGRVLSEEESKTTPTRWLRGRRRGVLAPLAVGTVDQVLTAVLRSPHNALRLLGLAGKVLVVDEAHAYDAYMQALLRRALTWLGSMGVPVVLLSATLPARVGESLVRAYLDGAAPGRDVKLGGLTYPGWVYADAATGEVTSRKVGSTQTRDLAVEMHPYQDGQRMQLAERLLAPVTEEGGCAVVVCNTVADAQDTYAELCRRFADKPVEVLLLHARLPQRDRAGRTEQVLHWFGKDGVERPQAAILVATQIVEQSLDLDFDLVVSDLAPLALLLQRAGRGHRHPGRTRPAWATAPRLAVLTPVDHAGTLAVPRAWGGVYEESLLERTHRLLTARAGAPIRVPADVQDLVDQVYGDFADGDERLLQLDTARLAGELAQEQLAGFAAIPRPGDVEDLHELSHGEIDDRLVATRLGADSLRILPVFVADDGSRWLDPSRNPSLEDVSGSEKPITRQVVREVLGYTIPAPAARWAHTLAEAHPVPKAWQEHPWLADLVLLPQHLTPAGPTATRVGGVTLRVDPELGLVITYQRNSQ
ncbi:CRISPR-associated helicase/endonuclease Cas3 [Carbonactinospora thermoautotrophica]|uniref:CRISPR-associated helicase/endonuclease Cas3 n=1 Tax=Carbonactinospora thermoautotrophica TaxID=1469144 RepID=UPI00082E99ED|nr:CRISPR-associated helicase/endonuclease Cas3 [Carbonactinospora thermoautotrophica]